MDRGGGGGLLTLVCHIAPGLSGCRYHIDYSVTLSSARWYLDLVNNCYLLQPS